MRKLLFVLFFVVVTLSFAGLGCFSKRTVSQDVTSATNEEVIEDEILVVLKGKVQPTALQNSFKEFGMSILKEISAPANIWLFGFDMKKIVPKKMLAEVKKSVYVKSAQFNHRVQLREPTDRKGGRL